MLELNIAPSEAIAGCAKGEAMADALTTRKLKSIGLFTMMMRIAFASSYSKIHAHYLQVYHCALLIRTRPILSAT